MSAVSARSPSIVTTISRDADAETYLQVCLFLSISYGSFRRKFCCVAVANLAGVVVRLSSSELMLANVAKPAIDCHCSVKNKAAVLSKHLVWPCSRAVQGALSVQFVV